MVPARVSSLTSSGTTIAPVGARELPSEVRWHPHGLRGYLWTSQRPYGLQHASSRTTREPTH
ncbi:hypothetical protein NONI108955_35980 [Nocardia ninae]